MASRFRNCTVNSPIVILLRGATDFQGKTRKSVAPRWHLVISSVSDGNDSLTGDAADEHRHPGPGHPAAGGATPRAGDPAEGGRPLPGMSGAARRSAAAAGPDGGGE